MTVTEYIQKKEAIETTRQRAYRADDDTRLHLLAVAKEAEERLAPFKLMEDRFGNKYIYEQKAKPQS